MWRWVHNGSTVLSLHVCEEQTNILTNYHWRNIIATGPSGNRSAWQPNTLIIWRWWGLMIIITLPPTVPKPREKLSSLIRRTCVPRAGRHLQLWFTTFFVRRWDVWPTTTTAVFCFTYVVELYTTKTTGRCSVDDHHIKPNVTGFRAIFS